ncbi:MAG: prepilin-type N-terminal cleavage/methylation domain-containing protein [Deltaproteobacteria bacterium]|nr:prepilin-type N-terminal cleavage/methylation domain-containing protein [Deltaproteobacteria bacterium]
MTGRTEAGFSLIEVVVAVAVLAIGLTAAFKLQIVDLDLVLAGRQTTRACLAGESLLWNWSLFGAPPEEMEEGRSNGMDYRAEFKVDQNWPGLVRLKLTLKDEASRGVSQRFERLLVKAGAQ